MKHLGEADPVETTPNKFRLRRLSDFADYEQRAGDRRAFHRCRGGEVGITLFGEPCGNRVIVEGEEFHL